MKPFLAALLLFALAPAAQAAPLPLERGDHICVIGNTLAERMQHSGWFETIIHRRFPRHELVVRNLGFSGDELTLRLRSAGFGTPDEHLALNKADVVLAFFGYNESFAGEKGLEKFKQDLVEFIRHTLAQQYNGKGAPRLVLFSPIAHENLDDPNLPDGSENNARLELYTSAMAGVARDQGVPFVDLFRPSLELYARAPEPLTINGIHLNDRGDRLLATVMSRAVFGPPTQRLKTAKELEPLRAAVLDKNFFWFQRHRTVDGYSIYGGRADLAFTDGQTNRVVMQREMEVLDVMTANRDRRVWAVAQGKTLEVDDANTPPFLEVITNKAGPLPGGKHVFLDDEEAISHMNVAQGMQVNLFASEEMFPELANPVQIAFDTKGRLWVAVMPSYPHWKPKEVMNDKVLILEDTNGDGRADDCKAFADRLHVPTGLEFWNGGLLVGQQPDLMFLKDLDGDDVADVRQRVLHGIDSADTHHALNSFVLDPGGALYFQEGTFHHTQVETPWGPPQRCANAGVFRFEPRTFKFDVFVSYGFANPHGHVFDRWGQDFVTDGTGNVNYYAAAFSGHLDFPDKHSGLNPFFPQRTRPCPATEILSSRHFPDEMQGDYLDGNVIGFQGILRYKFKDDGSGFAADEQEPLLSSTDASFRPTDLEIGPDGALYFSDWQNPIIGHMQHNLRDPSRDREHGRVYRLTYPSRPLLEPPAIAGEPIDALLDLLKEPENRVRYRAKIELGGRASDEVIEAVDRWIARLDKNDQEREHHILEALWVYQYHNRVNPGLLERVISSTDYRARAAGTRVLCYWRDRVPSALAHLKRLAADEHPRVRLEAVRAASFFTTAEAVEVPAIAADHPGDYFLDYTRGETLRALEPYWKRALADGREVAITTDAGRRFLLRNMTTQQLLAQKFEKAVGQELLFRPGVQDEQRREVVRNLANFESKSQQRVLLDAIQSLDEGKRGTGDESVVFDLVRLLAGRTPAELADIRGDLETLATSARQPVMRQIGFVALITVDGGDQQAWDLARSSLAALRDFVTAASMIPDAGLRASLYSRLEPLLHELPPELAGASGAHGTLGQFVRIELSGQRTLTLAEVEIESEGVNVARRGQATQKNVSNGGEAARAIDGNTSGEFGAGGQTHTEENTTDPWWEVDLGEELPIEAIVIHNRTEGDLGKRLDGFKLLVLDARRSPVFTQEGVPAPEPRARVELGDTGSAGTVRRSAMTAMASIRGQEVQTFQTLATFVRDDVDRLAAIRALLRIPRTFWPAEEAQPLIDSSLAWLRGISVENRTSPAALDTLEFADSLASLLPADAARAVRAELGELGVRTIRLGTLLERMSYDKEVIAVQTGKPVEFVFENGDLMPHNFVIVQPGFLAEVGLAAEATATQPEAIARQFVPVSDKILLASTLLQPRQSQKLSFTAPLQPGVYPYVCTYPGHWRRMYGAMYVVEDLDAYLAAPEAYLAEHALPIEDDLLKDRRPRTEWTYDDLATAVSELGPGHTYGSARQMFQVASCVACHKMDGVGNEFGPDLTKLDPKLQEVDIVREMLDPSAKINEKFQSYIFELESGNVLTALVVEESPEVLKVIENPLAKTEPREILRSQIVDQQKSPISLMPKGLLDKLTREEIMDLVAYVVARGNPDHEYFRGGHAHDHGGGNGGDDASEAGHEHKKGKH